MGHFNHGNIKWDYLQSTGVEDQTFLCLVQKHFLTQHVERGSSVGRMPDSQSRDPGFESPLLPFRSLGIFFHFTTPQSTQLYK